MQENNQRKGKVYMEIINFILNIVVILLIFLVGLFTKNYLPSYMDKKGENLATKEDIKEITRKTEEVQREFKEEFEAFSSDMKFKYDFFYRQYSELYCKLYAIVIQSEYVRHFIQITDGRIITFDEAPFLEISPTHRETMVRAQREMTLFGYDVYRFGGYEFVGADSDEKKKEAVLDDLKQFFLRLFSKYSAL